MYRPEHFDEKDKEVITRLMAEFPLATIVAQTKEGLVANHIQIRLPISPKAVTASTPVWNSTKRVSARFMSIEGSMTRASMPAMIS